MKNKRNEASSIRFLIILTLPMLIILSNCTHQPNEIPAPKTISTSTVTINPPSNDLDTTCCFGVVAPIIISNCAKSGCHDDASGQSGIRLTSYQNVISGISGNLLMQVIKDNGRFGMPPAPNTRLSSEQISLMQKWVNGGMKDGSECAGDCDTISVTYSITIKRIIGSSGKCGGCHSGMRPPLGLDTYSDLKILADNGKLSCTVNHLNGCSPMPKSLPKLSNCKLKQIQKWIDAGAPNN